MAIRLVDACVIASYTCRQMVDEHLPDHLFREFAAPVPEDESKRLVERACAIALMMEEDPYEPKDEETYRYIYI